MRAPRPPANYAPIMPVGLLHSSNNPYKHEKARQFTFLHQYGPKNTTLHCQYRI